MYLIPIPFSSLCFSLIKCLWSDRFLWGERNDISLNINCSLNISLFPTGEYISSQNRSYVSSHTVNSFNCHTTRPTLHGSHSRSLAKTINFYVKKKKFAFRYLEKKTIDKSNLFCLSKHFARTSLSLIYLKDLCVSNN